MSLNNEFDPIGGEGVPASPDAVAQEASPRIITAQPIKWEAHPRGQQWTEDRYGYCITLESEDLPETPYVATLGEGDPETFATLAEAQAWCQRDIDATVARWAVVAAQPPQAAPKAEAPAAPAEVGEAAAMALLNDWAEASGTHFVNRSYGQRTTDTVSRDDLLQLVRAALAAPAERGVQWQPIETAPKDGRTVLLGRFNSHGKWRTMRGCWMSADYIADFWEEPDGGEPGWYETSVEADDPPNCWYCHPTHWMPLPDAPGGITGGTEEPKQ